MTHCFNTEIASEVGIEEAILLENIFFWCQKNKANNKLQNGKPFTYNSVKAFNQIFPYMSPSTISRALKNLEIKGFIEIGEFNANAYDRTKWYCTTDKTDCFYQAISNESKIADSTCQDKKSICQNEKWSDEKSEQNIADINTDINTDTLSLEAAKFENREESEKLPEPYEDDSQGEKAALFSDENKYYARLVYNVWEKAGLKGSKDYITFLARDFKLALPDIREQRLHSDDVIQACKNYASVIDLKRKGKSWWTAEIPFYNFVKPKTIAWFLPDGFDLESFKKTDDKKGSAMSRSDEYNGNVEMDF